MNDSTFYFKRYSHNETISYVLLPIERLNDALKVLEQGFYPHECVSICTEVAKNSKAVIELNELSKECIKDGISIVAIDNTTNQIIGVSINKIQKKTTEGLSFFECFAQTRCKEEESTSLINFMIQCDADLDLFEHFKTNKLMEIMFLAVLPTQSKRGIGLELVKADLQLLDELATSFYGPEVATTLFTSLFSQKIGGKLDFEVFVTQPYTMFTYKGVKYSDKLDPRHIGTQLAAKRRSEKSFWTKYFK